MGGLFTAAEAVSQSPGPPRSLSPNQSPSNESGAQLGGLRWDDPGARAALPFSGCVEEDAAPLTSLEPASLRPTCHKAERLARRTSRLEHLIGFAGNEIAVRGSPWPSFSTPAACEATRKSRKGDRSLTATRHLCGLDKQSGRAGRQPGASLGLRPSAEGGAVRCPFLSDRLGWPRRCRRRQRSC